MTEYNQKKLMNIIKCLGEEKVNQLYHYLGSEKISFATLKHLIKEQKIRDAISNNMSVRKITGMFKVSKKTVYRKLNENKVSKVHKLTHFAMLFYALY